MNNCVSLGVGAATTAKEDVLSVLDSDRFSEVRDSLLEMWSNCIEAYTDGFLRYAGSVGITGGAVTYFPAVNASIGVKVAGLLSSTLTEFQSAIDAYISEAFSTTPDFCNQCWIKRLHIVNLFKDKNISIKWVKVKRHSNVLDNIRADMLANEATFSSLFLPVKIWKRFLVTEKTAISGNVCHFAQDLYWSICCAHWEAGSDFDIVLNIIIKEINWNTTAAIWHLD
ncbi:hypothetical protein G9A89_022943 [Geosiphon pyriformis]|nr:hypothetical protein G9A89_022943 [Geosiphon pyriformis]